MFIKIQAGEGVTPIKAAFHANLAIQYGAIQYIAHGYKSEIKVSKSGNYFVCVELVK